MDAKVGDWVVTPRRGKAVEINALWYNALRLLEGWLREEGGDAADAGRWPSTPSGPASRSTPLLVRGRAAICTTWSTARQGDDPACRPNQVFAISLDHPVLDRARWEPVLRRGARAAC